MLRNNRTVSGSFLRAMHLLRLAKTANPCYSVTFL
nr:MAG TPA: hypothetical protein [Caudoviricetes sp.]